MPLGATVFRTSFVSPELAAALTWARAKQVLSKRVFDNVDFRSRLESFTVAGNLTGDMISAIQKKANDTIERGGSYKDFADSLGDETLRSMTAPGTVFENAINNSYQRARFETQQDIKAVKPFLKYVTMNDDKVRPNHAILNGRVARQDDEFWAVNYPPNGHRCRCTARALSQNDLTRQGLRAQTMKQIQADVFREQKEKGIPESEMVKPLADPGWRGSFAMGQPGSDSLMKRLEKYNPKTFKSQITPDPISPDLFKKKGE